MTATPSRPRLAAARLIEPAEFRPPTPLTGLQWPAVPWVALAAVFTLLVTAGVMGYLFFARSVSLTSDPGEALLDVRGIAPRLGKHWLLLPGTHEVVAAAPGYKPYAAPLTVTDATLQRHTVALTPLPGQLSLSVAPVAEARVIIDGDEAGTAPGVLPEVEAGKRTITVEAPRYLPFTTTLDIRGKRETQSLEVTLKPAWADFALASEPAGAAVTLDGKLLGQTPLSGELLQGERTLTVTRPGYKPWSRTLKVEAGKAVRITDVRLAKADGVLEIITEPRGAAVTVDGRYRGESPVSVPVTPDIDHRITVMKAGFEPRTQAAQAAPDATAQVTLQLEAELGTLVLETTPADAELSVDGKPAGNATQRLSLTTSEHELVVQRDGYAGWRTRITPRKGVDKHVRVALKTAAQMAAEEVPPAANGMPPNDTAPSEAPPPMSEAQQQADIVAQQLVPPEVRERFEREAVARESMAMRDRQRGPRHDEQRRPPPPPATAGTLQTSLGQALQRFDGGALALPGRPPAQLKRPFYVATHEVTNGEFRRFLGSHALVGPNGQPLDAAALPVAGISWEAAAMFCNWLSRQESLPVFYQIRYGKVLGVNPDAVGYRLPTEAEWDFVAALGAGGKPLEFPWGPTFPPPARSGNFADVSGSTLVAQTIAGYDDGFAASAPPGSYPPNGRGLHDLAGNVAEWLHDFFNATPAGGVDPLGPATASQHVVRGGSWATGERARLRSLAREAAAETRPDLGFRLARYAQ